MKILEVINNEVKNLKKNEAYEFRSITFFPESRSFLETMFLTIDGIKRIIPGIYSITYEGNNDIVLDSKLLSEKENALNKNVFIGTLKDISYENNEVFAEIYKFSKKNGYIYIHHVEYKTFKYKLNVSNSNINFLYFKDNEDNKYVLYANWIKLED